MPPELSGHTRVFALLGRPVGHSWSPSIYNTLFGAYGVDAAYVALDVDPTRAADVPMALHTLGLAGVNLTVPLKEAVVPKLDGLDRHAARAGAVNVVVRESGRLVGYNTDGLGFLDSLPTDFSRHGLALVLGAGGAARAITAALADDAGMSVVVVNRTFARAERVVAQVGSPRVRACAWSEVDAWLPHARLVVQACTQIHENIAVERLPEDALWVDLNYWDPSPPFVSRLGTRRVQRGGEMLLAQAVRAFYLFTGIEVPFADATAIWRHP